MTHQSLLKPAAGLLGCTSKQLLGSAEASVVSKFDGAVSHRIKVVHLRRTQSGRRLRTSTHFRHAAGLGEALHGTPAFHSGNRLETRSSLCSCNIGRCLLWIHERETASFSSKPGHGKRKAGGRKEQDDEEHRGERTRVEKVAVRHVFVLFPYSLTAAAAAVVAEELESVYVTGDAQTREKKKDALDMISPLARGLCVLEQFFFFKTSGTSGAGGLFRNFSFEINFIECIRLRCKI